MMSGITPPIRTADVPPGVTLRAAAEADVPSIARFHTDCWREAYRGLVPDDYLDRVTAADREARWRDRLVSGARHVLLAESIGDLVGVASWAPCPPPGTTPSLELMSLYVKARHRGTGLADALVRATIGDSPAQLWVFTGNHRAIAFYDRHGFRATGDERIDEDTGLTVVRLAREHPAAVRASRGGLMARRPAPEPGPAASP